MLFYCSTSRVPGAIHSKSCPSRQTEYVWSSFFFYLYSEETPVYFISTHNMVAKMISCVLVRTIKEEIKIVFLNMTELQRSSDVTHLFVQIITQGWGLSDLSQVTQCYQHVETKHSAGLLIWSPEPFWTMLTVCRHWKCIKMEKGKCFFRSESVSKLKFRWFIL